MTIAVPFLLVVAATKFAYIMLRIAVCGEKSVGSQCRIGLEFAFGQ